MKVAVIGCSVNGAYTAYTLSKAGHEVTVFDRKTKIGGKACSGLVSQRIWNYIPENEKLLENVVNSVKVNFPSKTTQVIFKPRMLALNRGGLDEYVASVAKEAGTEIKLGHSFIGFDNGNNITLRTQHNGKEEVENFDFLVGSDGSTSAVRNQVCGLQPKFRLGLYCYAQEDSKQDWADVWATDFGFFWRIPRGDHSEYGVIEKPDVARKGFDNFARDKNIKVEQIFSAVVPEGLCLSNNSKVALCGDAAGLTKPHSGGGILWGFAAADLLVKSNLDVAKYNSALKRKFGSKLAGLSKLTKFVNFMGNNAAFLMPKRINFDNDWAFF